MSLEMLWLAAIVAIGGGLRIVGLQADWLWYDELLSVNFSAHGPLETLLTVARFDVHPPLYYVQLALWMEFGASDSFVMANSVAWSALTILIVCVAGWQLSGRMAGDYNPEKAEWPLGLSPGRRDGTAIQGSLRR